MKGYNDRPHGWPADRAGSRRHDGGSSTSLVPEILTYELIDRRMREASDARLASMASDDRTRDGHVVRFRGRLGRAIMAFGRALGGESRPAGLPSSRKAVAPSGRGLAEPGC